MLILTIALILLFIALAATRFMARQLGFSREDEIVLVSCGSRKSLASGVPMAGVLFPAATVGIMVMPLMIFHQVQLMVAPPWPAAMRLTRQSFVSTRSR